jgi:hypothetical protein
MGDVARYQASRILGLMPTQQRYVGESPPSNYKNIMFRLSALPSFCPKLGHVICNDGVAPVNIGYGRFLRLVKKPGCAYIKDWPKQAVIPGKDALFKLISRRDT